MKYRPRLYEQQITKLAKIFKVIFLVGARQVGKSSLLLHLFPDLKVFVFDPVQDLYGVRANPDRFLQDFDSTLILDEVQFVPQLLPALKRQVDLKAAPGQYFLTGSQQVSILKTVAESMAGRVAILEIGGMTPQEMYDHFDVTKNWFLSYLKDPAGFFKSNFAKINNLPTSLFFFLCPNLCRARYSFIRKYSKFI